jgi:hypothetical protein
MPYKMATLAKLIVALNWKECKAYKGSLLIQRPKGGELLLQENENL